MGRGYDFDIAAQLRVSPPFTDPAEAERFIERLEGVVGGGETIAGIVLPCTLEPAFAIPSGLFDEIVENGNTEGAESNTPERALGWLRVLAAVLAEFGRTIEGVFEGLPADQRYAGDGSDEAPAFRIVIRGDEAQVSVASGGRFGVPTIERLR